jgi:hypothetical protein
MKSEVCANFFLSNKKEKRVIWATVCQFTDPYFQQTEEKYCLYEDTLTERKICDQILQQVCFMC